MSFLIEKGIEPLVNALNKLDFVTTVYSCEGHFDREQSEKFLPTAYVTFDVGDVEKFSRLYEWLSQLSSQSEAGRLRLTYDCILGRYTLSVWPKASSVTPRHKRQSVDAAVTLLADVIVDYMCLAMRAGTGACPYDVPGKMPVNPEKSALPPCQLSDNSSVRPCTLVIPPKEFVCPFLTLKDGLESER